MPPVNPHRIDDPPLPESEQAAFLQSVVAGGERAEAARGARAVMLDLARTRVRLIFAGHAVGDLFLPALAHLIVDDDGVADMTIHVWDSASSGVTMPPPPVSVDCFSNRGDIWRMPSARYRSAFHWVENSVSVMDVESRVGAYWAPTMDGLPFWAKASPFRTLFHWWLESIGGQLLHGAAFGGDDGALLITGKGGIGKSTTALTCLTHGLSYIGDDYLAVRLDPEPRVYSLYCTAKLNGPQMERFPALNALVSNQGFTTDEKAVVGLLPTFASQVVRSLPLRAISTPVFAGEPATSFVGATKLSLQRAATFTTMSQLPHAGAALHAFMHRLVHAVPGFTLRLGSELSTIPAAMLALLAQSDAWLASTASAAEPTEHQPLVTVIIPVYNGARFLAEAVNSVLAQQYPQIEIIVVDDGSTDDLAAAIAALPVEVRLLEQSNAGPAAARNRGLKDAGGDFIAFLDVDDLWPEGNLSHLVHELQHEPALQAIHGRAQLMRRNTAGVDEYVGDPAEAFPFYIGAGVYRRSIFATVGLFDANLKFGEDADWFRRAEEQQVAIRHADEVCLFVRRHDGNMTLGKSTVELNALRVVKLAMDRRRAAQGAGGA